MPRHTMSLVLRFLRMQTPSRRFPFRERWTLSMLSPLNPVFVSGIEGQCRGTASLPSPWHFSMARRATRTPCFLRYDEGETEAEGVHFSMDVSNPIFQLYEAVRRGRNSQGQLIAEPFMQLPSRKDYSDYFHQIKQPISLQQIRSKMKNNEYESLKQMEADLLLMFENAKSYNVPHSHIYKRVVKLQQILQEKEDVPVDMSSGEPGCQYYEQLHYNDTWQKVGDCVYIRSHGLVRHRVGRIEKMWVRDGAAYFLGPIFVHPEETEHEPTKMFYKKEVFLSNLEEAYPMSCVIGKCAVCSFKDYLSCRPTDA